MSFRLPLLLLGLVSAAAAFATDYQPGQVYFGAEHWIEYDAGDLPIVLTSPHGGRLRPAALPDREDGVTEMDLNSQELARAIADELLARTGHRPDLIASQLHRRKLDPNREIKEAAAGVPAAEQAWREFHAYVEAATAAAVARHGFAFLIDVHGHAHPIPRIELGYGVAAVQLNQTDTAFDASDFAALSTFRDLHARLGGSGANLLRGPHSLGDLFQQRGIRAVPSPQEPSPGKNVYFDGGYIVRQHSASKVIAVQIETYRPGLRDTAADRAHFAQVAAEVVTIFLHERYHYDFPAKK
jgi:N-formylglutamate amidohydrolase